MKLLHSGYNRRYSNKVFSTNTTRDYYTVLQQYCCTIIEVSGAPSPSRQKIIQQLIVDHDFRSG